MSTQFLYPNTENAKEFPRITLGHISALEWQLIIFGGMVFCLPVIMMLGENTLWSKNPIEWAFWANAIVSMPHVMSTWVRLQRKIDEGRIAQFFGLPMYACTIGLLAWAMHNNHFLEVMTAVNVWQSFHYARQVYGVGRFYTDRSEETAESKNLMFWAYHLAMPLFVLGRWSMLYTAWHGKPSTSIIPVQMPDWLMAICWILAGVGLCVGLFVESMKFRRPVYNPVGLIILSIYYAIHWFGFLSIAFYMRGFIAITIYHAFQYLGMVWINERRERKKPLPVLGLWTNAPPEVSFLIFWVALYVGGYFMEDKILMFFNGFWTSLSAVVLGALSAHHYAVDTIMWQGKMSRSK